MFTAEHMQESLANLKENLIKIFSLPFYFSSEESKRFLTPISKPELDKYRLLAADCSYQATSLMVAARKAELSAKGIEWDCVVRRFDDLTSVLNNLLSKNLQPGEKHRQQVILYCLNHVCNLDIEICETAMSPKITIAALDAVGDGLTYKHAVIPALQQLKKDPLISAAYHTTGAIQFDELTCAIQAFAIAKQLPNIPDFHEFLRKNANDKDEIKWSQLPVALLRQAQSKTFLQSVANSANLACNKKGESVSQYFQRHCGFFSGEVEPKARNFAATDLYLKMAKKILPVIEKLTLEQIVEIIEDKSNFPIKMNDGPTLQKQ